jgi:transposase-like protein
LLLERGIEVNHQAIKNWNIRVGEVFANEIQKHRHKPTRRWHIDEIHIKKKRLETLYMESSTFATLWQDKR